MQIEKDFSRLLPRILLEPHSLRMGKSNHQKLLHFFAMPNSEPGSQTPFIGTLCEQGCESTFNNKSVHIKNKQSGSTIMRVTRYARTNLYMLSLTQKNNLMTESTNPDEYLAGSAYECKSKKTLVDYHHASCWSPIRSGWGKAITKNFFTSLPGLSVDLVHQHLKKKQSTVLGHLQQPWKGLRSTQEKVMHSDPDPEHEQFHQATQTEDTYLVFSRQLIFPENFIQIK